jgi:glycosyltransferase involved in cell wall biosynthesis
MRRILVVSPHFPPTSAADMHRVRQSLQYFPEFGWQPSVLAVEPEFVEGRAEPLLLETVPAGIDVTRVRALPTKLTRKIGLGDIALRSFPFLYRAGARIIRDSKIDLVYFSTTAFPAVALGRIWKEKFGVPFVVDMQDPWLSDYYKDKPANARPPKYWFSQRLHGILEPWTMERVDGLVSVSPDYLTTLRQRYPWLADRPQAVLPFGASSSDFEVVRNNPQPNRFFKKGTGSINGVYVGRGGKDMEFALQVMFRAFRLGLKAQPDIFGKIKLHFVGTDYAMGRDARKTVAPVAEVLGLSGHVEETPERVPYFEALQLLRDADFLIVPGSDDPQYTASKIYPYILACKPLLAAFNQRSSVCQVLRETRAGALLPFEVSILPAHYAPPFMELWSEMLRRLPFVPDVNWAAFAPYTAYEMTRAQSELFNRVISEASTNSAVSARKLLTPVRSEKTCSN